MVSAPSPNCARAPIPGLAARRALGLLQGEASADAEWPAAAGLCTDGLTAPPQLYNLSNQRTETHQSWNKESLPPFEGFYPRILPKSDHT